MDAVHNWTGWATAAALLPLPGLDLTGIVAVHLNMLREIGAVYGHPFATTEVRPLVVTLLGSGGSYILAWPASSLLKAIPIVGPIAGLITLPALAAAASYAMGKVFIQHFESGGTFLDFDPVEVRAFYAREFEAAKARRSP